MKQSLKLPSVLLLFLGVSLMGCSGTTSIKEMSSEKTLFVAPFKADCVGVAPQKCYLIKKSPDAEWTYLYNEIEGFDYEEGYTYELRVAEHRVENLPADASSIKLKLVDIVSKTPATSHPETIGSKDLLLRQWLLQSFGVVGSEDSVIPNAEISLGFTPDSRIYGSGGCNRYFGRYQGGQGNTLSIRGVGSTKMFCRGHMDQERKYFEALLNTSAFKVDEPELRLFSDNGRRVLNFVETD